MDRVIKFRFWRDNTMQMAHTMNAYDNNNFAGDGEILMQFTGLYDCEGKEIYEKDIVEVELFGIIKQYVILWRNDFFCWAYLPLEYAKETLEGWGDAFEGQLTYQHKPRILGNIYEHPNLLQ